MKINILQGIGGAKAAKGLAVVIDVFRAITVESYLMHNGCSLLIPTGDIAYAHQYKEEHPGTILIGERHGRIIDGFDYGNSPSQIKDVDFTGKTVVHTTSAGTQGIANATQAEEIITACLANAAAVAEYIRRGDPEEVSLICMGLEGVKPTDEDNLCAEYIRGLLLGEPVATAQKVRAIRDTDGAKFFDIDQQDVFPEADFWLSTEFDRFHFVMKVCKDRDSGISFITKEEMR